MKQWIVAAGVGVVGLAGSVTFVTYRERAANDAKAADLAAAVAAVAVEVHPRADFCPTIDKRFGLRISNGSNRMLKSVKVLMVASRPGYTENLVRVPVVTWTKVVAAGSRVGDCFEPPELLNGHRSEDVDFKVEIDNAYDVVFFEPGEALP